MKKSLLTLACLLLAACSFAQEGAKNEAAKNAPAPKLTYIKAGHLFDSVSGELKHNMVIVVEGERIKQVGPAATANAADLVGRGAEIGSIEAGKYADIIAVNADPLADVRALESVDFVMKGGKVYKQGGKAVE